MEYKYEGHSLKSGIYKIINKINGRIYIGSAKRFKTRWSQHTSSLRGQKHQNKFLQADFNKCGEEAFVFEVIEVTENKTKEERLMIEEGYIKQYYDKGNNCYNLCDRAISREGNPSKDPEATRNKLRGKVPWNKGKHTGIEPWNKGKTDVYSEETLEKIRQARAVQVFSEGVKEKRANKLRGRARSNETKAKIGAANSVLMKKKWEDTEYRESQLEKLKSVERVYTEEMREAAREASKNRTHSAEIKQKLKEIKKQHWEDPDFREKTLAGMNDPEIIERNRQATIARWQNEEFRERAIEAMRNGIDKDERSKTSKKRWEDPEYKARVSAKIKASWEKRKLKKKE